MDPKDLFEILVREHAGMLLVYLRCAVRDPVLIDDLFQETMLTAWKTLDRFDRNRPFGPWLRGIAARLILAQRRKTARGMLLCDEPLLEQLETRHQSFQQLAGDTLEEKLETLLTCLSLLPARYREAIELRYRGELRGPRLAERLGISTEATKKRLQRARSRLHDCLKRRLAVAGIA